jgi:hypothetical protein
MMEKRAETSEKFLCRIAKMIGRNKRKRGGDDDEVDTYDDGK